MRRPTRPSSLLERVSPSVLYLASSVVLCVSFILWAWGR